MSEAKELNPDSVMCVVKHEGKEVGRIAATAPNASAYIAGLALHYKSLSVEYVEGPTEARIDRLVRTTK